MRQRSEGPSTRERLLDATARCIERDGVASVGIAAVASEARVSRPTVYRYFEGRDDLVQSTLMRAAGRLHSRLGVRLRRFRKPARMAVEAVLFSLAEVEKDPVLKRVWSKDALDAATIEGFTLPPSIAFTRRAIRDLEAAAGWDDATAREATEVMLRFILSLLAAPEPRRSRDALRRFLERRLVPALDLQEFEE